jgi:membrane dipeptidase
MRYFDLHCDTITECCLKNIGLEDNEQHISVKAARAFETWVQVFAVWMPDTLRGAAAWERFLKIAAYFKKETNSCGIIQCKNGSELKNAVTSGHKNAAILSIEGSAALGGNIDNLKTAYDMGVRIITLTWNGACEAGGGSFDGSGLTHFGFELIEKMQKLGIIIDVSHLSDQGFNDVAQSTDAVFIASHSDSRSVSENKRNLTDEQFSEIVRRHGIVGLNLYPPFVGSDSLTGILRHIDKFLSLGGENTLAIGADFDGARMPEGISGIADMPKLYELLFKNYGKTVADKIFFDNAYKFFETF